MTSKEEKSVFVKAISKNLPRQTDSKQKLREEGGKLRQGVKCITESTLKVVRENRLRKHTLKEYSSQHLKWIKKVHQSCPKTRTHFGFRFYWWKVLIHFKCWLVHLNMKVCHHLITPNFLSSFCKIKKEDLRQNFCFQYKKNEWSCSNDNKMSFLGELFI